MAFANDVEDPGGIDPAKLVKRARARSGFSQRDLARRAGTSQSVVARIEVGETNPTVSTLNRLLEAAGFRLSVELREGPGSRSVGSSGGGGDRRNEDGGTGEIGRLVREFVEAQGDPGIASIYLFGSAARGELHGESDVDLAVLLDRSIHPSRSERAELRIRLSAKLVSALGRNEVDLVVLNDLPPPFARAIVLHGIRLVRANPDLDHGFVRDAQLRAAELDPFLRRMRRIKLEALARCPSSWSAHGRPGVIRPDPPRAPSA